MKSVGVRELKNRLSHYLRLVRRSGTVRITNRGQVVAELRAPDGGRARRRIDPGLARLIEKHIVIPGTGHDPGLYPHMPRIAPDGTAEALIDETRGER